MRNLAFALLLLPLFIACESLLEDSDNDDDDPGTTFTEIETPVVEIESVDQFSLTVKWNKVENAEYYGLEYLFYIDDEIEGGFLGGGMSVSDTTNLDYMTYTFDVREALACGANFKIDVIGEGYSDAIDNWVYSPKTNTQDIEIPQCESELYIMERQVSREFCDPEVKFHSSLFYLGLKNLTYTDSDDYWWAMDGILNSFQLQEPPQVTYKGFDNGVNLRNENFYVLGPWILSNYVGYDSYIICDEGEHSVTVSYTVTDMEGNEVPDSPITYTLEVPN